MMEGSGASRLYQLFGGGSAGSSGVDIKRAIIKTLPPEISVQVDGDSIDTPSEGIIVAEHLLEHKRTISFTGGTVSGQVQDTYSGGGDLRSLEIIDGELTFKCDLKVGDPVIVSVANDGQMIYVIDKAVE